MSCLKHLVWHIGGNVIPQAHIVSPSYGIFGAMSYLKHAKCHPRRYFEVNVMPQARKVSPSYGVFVVAVLVMIILVLLVMLLLMLFVVDRWSWPPPSSARGCYSFTPMTRGKTHTAHRPSPLEGTYPRPHMCRSFRDTPEGGKRETHLLLVRRQRQGPPRGGSPSCDTGPTGG